MRTKWGLSILFLFLILLVQIIFAEELNIKDLKILNSSTSVPLGLIVYKIVEIDKNFDSTFNTWYFSTKNANSSIIEINFENENEFSIWNFYVEKDGIPYVFIPKPQIVKKDKKFNFNYVMYFEEADLVKIQFELNNIIPIRNQSWYPFDKYKLILVNTTFSEGVSVVEYIKFPESLIMYEGTSVANAPIKKIICDNKIKKTNIDVSVEAKQRITDISFSKITPEVYIYNGSLSGMRMTYFYPVKGEYVPSSCQPYLDEISLSFPIEISRSPFPSLYLFIVIGIFVFYISIYGFYKKSKSFNKYIEYVYVRTTLPLILSEIVVSIIPPYRPLSFTLFDTIILWPLFIYVFIDIVNEKIKKPRSE